MKTGKKIFFGALMIFFSFAVFFDLGTKTAYGYWYVSCAGPNDHSSYFCGKHYASYADCGNATAGLGYAYGWCCAQTNDPCALTPPSCPANTNGNSCTADACHSGNTCSGGVCGTPVRASCSLLAAPSTIDQGGSSVLSWSDNCANSGSIDKGVGNAPPPSGNKTVSPVANTTYTMTVNGSGGNSSCTASVNFPPPSCTIIATPSGAFSGDTTTIYWTATAVKSGTINGIALTPAEIAAGSGNKITPPITGNVTYSMTVTGAGGDTASCGPVTIGILTPPAGGLVPCGRLADDLSTADINESKPCDLCSAMYMLKKMLNFTMEIATGIAIFIIIIGGLLYAFSAGNPKNTEKAKSAITYAITGLVIIFIAWLIVAIILNAMGYADITHWNQVNCTLQK